MSATPANPEAGRFLAALSDPASAQREHLLKRILAPNCECEYGRKFRFSSVRSPRDFQQAVPISQYEDLRKDIERLAGGEQGILTSEPVRRIFLTSGSTAAPKFIPVTASLIRDKSRAFQIYWSLLFAAHPDARRGKIILNFSDAGSQTFTPGGTPCGSESSFWGAWTAGVHGRGHYPLPTEVSRIEDFDSRYYTIARILLEEDVSVLMTLNPSTMLLLFETMSGFAERLMDDVERGGLSADARVEPEARAFVQSKYSGNPARAGELRAVLRSATPRLRAASVWPGLKLVACWRSPMLRPYLDLLGPHLGSLPQRDYLSMASEGILAIPLEDNASGGALATSIHFYEFIPEEQAEKANPEVFLAHELETNRNYVLLLTTSAGLYRYNLGDVIRVRGFTGATPLVEFLHRTGATCSLTGEKLTEDQVIGAVSQASRRLGFDLDSFTAFPTAQPFPHYVVLAEIAERPGPGALKEFLLTLDRELACRNIEYSSKRNSRRLGALELWVVRPGSYAAWRQRRIAEGASDAQAKSIHLTRDMRFHEPFEIAERIHAH